MRVSLEHNNKRYVNFDLSDEKVVEQLKSLGVDVETLAKKVLCPIKISQPNQPVTNTYFATVSTLNSSPETY